MSKYGRLWQQAAEIRKTLMDLVPADREHAGPRMNTLENAIREVAQHHARLQDLLVLWASVERDMAKEPNEGESR